MATSIHAGKLLLAAGLALGLSSDRPAARADCAAEPRPAAQAEPPKRANLPAYSEEREAAALHFVKKHMPELLPLLEKLKEADVLKYRQEVREIFHVSELLTNLCHEDPKRCGLELDLWKTEAKALILVARLAVLSDEERAKHTEELKECARKLIDLDMQLLKLRVEELEKDLLEAREDLSKTEEKRDTLSNARYERLFELAKRRGMMK